ncbi:hypothetical protein BDP27DRAFT_554563 [Rhodocollybia butyracea]|uniref:Uncharacterized protein n=1 Tax=Rhodocollybia butyracea TaxID=206335 RepID=A0A9P5PZ36_9AGAR|nr:hypothetical protein BDP27DRAFT_554563 [Rhodocollybia butyracea]
MNASPPFQVPLTFLNLSSICDAPFPTSTMLASWGSSRMEDNTAAGSIVGLEDGSVLILRRSEIFEKRAAKSLLPPPSPATLSQTSSITTASGSTSPSGSHISPFTVSSRSRIVSSVTTEQVEAPKNYVDFDDEPEKLKDMLKGKGPRDVESHREKSAPVDPKPPALPESSSFRRRPKEPLKFMLSATASPSLTALSISTPPSPNTPTQTKISKLDLVCHVIPPRIGQRNRVTGLELLHGDELSALLSESGDVAILSTRDGKCFANVQIADINLLFSDGAKHSASMHDVWNWTHLRSYVAGEPLPS